MAFRRPLYWFLPPGPTGGHLREMDDTMIGVIRQRAIYMYGSNPSSHIRFKTPAERSAPPPPGTMSTMQDTRKQAGAVSTHVSSFVAESGTAEPGTVTIDYSNLVHYQDNVSLPSDTIGHASTNNTLYPVYQDSNNNIRAMDNTDMYDTIFTQCIDLLVDGTARDGTYRFETLSSINNYTKIADPTDGLDLVYRDTRANTSAYAAGTIGDHALDNPTTITNYYLHRVNQGNSVANPQNENCFFIFDTSKNLRQYPDPGALASHDSSNGIASFDQCLLDGMRYWCKEKLRYDIGGDANSGYSAVTGSVAGSQVTDTILNGAGDYQQRYYNTDDYRSQEFPNGTDVTAKYYNLKVRRI